MKQLFFTLTITLALCFQLYAQQADYRPGLFFREDWTLEPLHSEKPLAQKHVMNPDLIVNTHGQSIDSLSKSHHAKPLDDPHYVWSGMCLGNWMVSLRHNTHNVDLSGFSKIKWRTKQAGFRKLHITIKLADGTWLVSDVSDPKSADWRVREFIISGINWYTLDMDLMSEMELVEDPDLTNVEEIGFTDLMSGGRWFACSRLDWIEVYGQPVGR